MSNSRSVESFEERCVPNKLCLKEFRGFKWSYTNFMPGGEIDDVMKNQLKEYVDFMQDVVLRNTENDQNPTLYTGVTGLVYTFVRLCHSNMEDSLLENSKNDNNKAAYDLLRKVSKYYEKKFSKIYQSLEEQRSIQPSIMCGKAGFLYVASFYYAYLAKYEKPQHILPVGSRDHYGANQQQEEILDFSKKAEIYKMSFSYRKQYVELTSRALRDDVSDEWLYGRSGYLYGLLSLRNFMNDSVLFDPSLYMKNHIEENKNNEKMLLELFNHSIQAIVSKIIQSGKTYSIKYNFHSDCPLMYEWHHKKYLGGAHGLVGILYMLLCTTEVTSNPTYMELIKKSCEYVRSLETKNMNYPITVDKPDDHLIQFCHGATAVVFLFLKCAEFFEEKQWMDAAVSAGFLIWKYGLLKKSFSLCHGLSGNGYTFLALYRATKDDTWYNRAIHFASKMQSQSYVKRIRPDNPYSLFEGFAGNILFANDLIKPSDKSCFPFFELGNI